MANSLAAPTSFPQFSILPTELQLQIFELIITPRCIKLGMAISWQRAYEYLLIPSIEEEPTILQINHLTRTEFLPRYPQILSGKYKKLGFSKTKTYGIRFNSALDTLAYHHLPNVHNGTYLVPQRTLHGFAWEAPASDLAAITCLAIELQQLRNIIESRDSVWSYIAYFESLCWFRKFTNLKTLLVINSNTNDIIPSFSLHPEPVEDPLVKIRNALKKAEEEGRDWKAPVVESVISAFPAWGKGDFGKKKYLDGEWHWAAGLERRIVARRQVVEVQADGKGPETGF